MEFHQIDCLKKNITFFKILGIWPSKESSRLYKYYSTIILIIFHVFHISIYTINFTFLPVKLDVYANEMTVYMSDVIVVFKALMFYTKRKKVDAILEMLESEIFQSNTPEGIEIIKKAKKTSLLYRTMTAGISYFCVSMNALSPIAMYFVFGVELQYPITDYQFIPEQYRTQLFYPAYVFQIASITVHMLCNVNIDTFLLGIMFLVIAQLDILDLNSRKVGDLKEYTPLLRRISKPNDNDVIEINKCIKHYTAISEFCKAIQEAFSEMLFVQFGLGSGLLCACLFRFTLPADTVYYMFLSSYMTVMTLQMMVPCWFGTQIIEKSQRITFAIYDSNWIPRSRQFKSNMKLLVERATRPLSITCGKRFPLSLLTFASIMNTAYSFYTLLRNMQSR